MVTRLEGHYARLEEELRRTNRQAAKQEIFEKITNYSPNNASRTFIGDIFCEYVPQAGMFQPQATQHENELDFAPVFQFFYKLFQQDFARQLAEEMFGDRT